MAPHSSTLAWKIPWTEEPGRLRSMGSRRVGHDWVTSLSLFTFMHWKRKWQPTPVFLPGESQGREEPGGLLSVGLHRVRHDWSDLVAAAAAVVTISRNASWQFLLVDVGWSEWPWSLVECWEFRVEVIKEKWIWESIQTLWPWWYLIGVFLSPFRLVELTNPTPQCVATQDQCWT